MSELIGELAGQLGIDESQAAGGAGIIFKFLQENLGSGDFSQIAEAVPGLDSLIDAAPDEGAASKLIGGLGSLLGGKAEDLASLGSLAAAFKSLDLDMDMVAKFIPAIVSFVRSQGGDSVAALLENALNSFVND